MASLIIALTAIVATCSAAIVPSGLPHPVLSHPGYASPLLDGWGGQVASPLVRHRLPEEYAPAHYDFDYSVNDPITGDSKDQAETRVGDDVQGHYSLIEADGSKRIVEYTAGVQGFNAVVHKEPATGPLVGPAAKIAPNPLVSAVPRTPSWNGLNSWDSYNPYTHNALATPYGLASPYSRHAIADQYSHHALNAPYNQYGYGHPAHRTPLDARSGPWGLY